MLKTSHKSLFRNWQLCSGSLILFPVFFILMMNGSLTRASEEQDRAAAIEEKELLLSGEGIQGIIVDNTMTFIGRRFYEAFSIAWLDYKESQKYNFSIHERATARSGSRVWIEHNRQRLVEVVLTPTLADIRDAARKAAKQVSKRFQTMQLEKALFKNPDLAADEF